MIFISSAFNGAPASPSTQQAPLHFDRSHTNLRENNSSVTILSSISINMRQIYRKEMMLHKISCELFGEMWFLDNRSVTIASPFASNVPVATVLDLVPPFIFV